MEMNGNREPDRSKLDASDVNLKLTSSSPVASKLSNFWYYHKWKVIIIGFFVIVLVVGVVQMLTKEESDNSVIIAVPADIEQEQIDAIDKVLTSFLPNDADGNGTKVLDIYFYPIYTEDELNAANTSETDEEGNYIPKVSQQYNVQKAEEYRDYLQTGECSVLLVSEDLYSKLRGNDRVLPLDMVFGESLPVGAMSDGCGVRLGDTYVYKYYPELQVLPEDTVICLLRSYFMGASSDEAVYENSKKLFSNVVSFGEE